MSAYLHNGCKEILKYAELNDILCYSDLVDNVTDCS